MKLPQLPQDKANHFIYGVVIFMALAFLLTPLMALPLILVIGVLKELYDKVSGTGTPERLDAISTCAGGLAGYICTLVK